MFLELLFGLLLIALGLAVVVGVVYVLYSLYRMIFLRFHYSEVQQSVGEVTDMEYTPPRTTFNGKTTIRHPEKNVVFIKTEQKETQIDSDSLYQRCRIGDKVRLIYQVRYAEPRFWNGNLEHDGFRLISVRCPKKQVVEFNDEKPISRKVQYLKEMDQLRK